MRVNKLNAVVAVMVGMVCAIVAVPIVIICLIVNFFFDMVKRWEDGV